MRGHRRRPHLDRRWHRERKSAQLDLAPQRIDDPQHVFEPQGGLTGLQVDK